MTLSDILDKHLYLYEVTRVGEKKKVESKNRNYYLL